MSDDPDSPDTEVDVSLLDPAWSDDVASVEDLARRAALTALRHVKADLPPKTELSLVLADDARVRRLNRDHRGRDSATNVLAFANLGGPDVAVAAVPRLLGDVVVARQTLLREAAAQGKEPGQHLLHLIVHGVLHLLGFDHQDEAEADRMEALETRILAELGVSDPYADGAPPSLASG